MYQALFPGTRDTPVKKADRNPCPWRANLLVRETDNKQNISVEYVVGGVLYNDRRKNTFVFKL